MMVPVTVEITGMSCRNEECLPLQNTPLGQDFVTSVILNDLGMYCLAEPTLILFWFTLVIQEITLSENLGLNFVDEPLPPGLVCSSVDHEMTLSIAVASSVEVEALELKPEDRTFKICSVCESEATGPMYYGGLACFRCMTFFKRALQVSKQRNLYFMFLMFLFDI